MHAVLEAAKEWGIPPWEIAGGDKLVWYYRWLTYKNHQARPAHPVQTEQEVSAALHELGL